MIARIWHTELAADRVRDYERFARERSLPMFSRQSGLLGVLLLGGGRSRAVLTLWDGPAAIERLEASTAYRQTAGALAGSGILAPHSQHVETHEVTAGWSAAFGEAPATS
jgi:heme-degrading monooxygenase HmoA